MLYCKQSGGAGSPAIILEGKVGNLLRACEDPGFEEEEIALRGEIDFADPDDCEGDGDDTEDEERS